MQRICSFGVVSYVGEKPMIVKRFKFFSSAKQKFFHFKELYKSFTCNQVQLVAFDECKNVVKVYDEF